MKKEICILGGSGFLGSAITAQLANSAYRVKILTRDKEHAKHLILLPNVVVEPCDIFDLHALTHALRGASVVINTVGILHAQKRHGFSQVHHQLPSQLAQVCVDLNVQQLIHISSLGASPDAPSQYLKTKAAGEAAIIALKNTLHFTIFKPSVIFGRGDQFIQLFAKLLRLMPVLLIAQANTKFQPIWVEDVAACVIKAIENDATYGQVYELAGPKTYTLKNMLQTVAHIIGVKRPIIGLPYALGYVQAWMLEHLPHPPMSRDNLKSLLRNNTSTQTIAPEFKLQPAALEAIAPTYLSNQTPRGGYDRYRRTAAR